MKIKKGDRIEEISLPKIDGTIFNLSETKGKKVLLTFYRIAGCSFCNLRLNEFKRRFQEFGENFTHVGIFHSPINNLESYMNKHGTLPFIILADEGFKYYKKYEIERSLSKLLAAMIFKAHKIFPALIKGYIPFSIKGYFDIAVTDILINEKGLVEEVYYAKKDIADHFSFDKIKEFSL
jgi:peroxiredoxin|tara:strand:- start:486 stop:1022 length:537 start_codon:yes stop_codon:yes gene_type:complete